LAAWETVLELMRAAVDDEGMRPGMVAVVQTAGDLLLRGLDSALVRSLGEGCFRRCEAWNQGSMGMVGSRCVIENSYPFFDQIPGIQRQLAAAVRRTCPPFLADRADDLVQTALIKLMERTVRNEGDQAVSSSYLWKVAYSAVIDEIRRVRRRREIPLDEETNIHEPASPEPGPESRASARRIGEGILDCLRTMIESRRIAVTLHLQGHTVPDISRLLDWETKRADNLVYRGLADLRLCLEKKGLKP